MILAGAQLVAGAFCQTIRATESNNTWTTTATRSFGLNSGKLPLTAVAIFLVYFNSTTPCFIWPHNTMKPEGSWRLWPRPSKPCMCFFFGQLSGLQSPIPGEASYVTSWAVGLYKGLL
ncbi:uncharacterized protein BJX67DRAFT_350239 [Aspergillus lucknowensis]|uniref:Secreted protein n=1 Tax=Aspergillus lucknowensis TaxID=176173 RepID=A0ABR4LUV6_9EURO